MSDRPVRRAVSFVITGPEPGTVLSVRRPPDDPDLPDVWGLPAGSPRPGESDEDAVRRSGREKLGVRLRVGDLVREGTAERGERVLRMRVFEAEIREGEPEVPQAVEGITQYTAWRWAAAGSLREAARRGSLCSRLYLASLEEA